MGKDKTYLEQLQDAQKAETVAEVTFSSKDKWEAGEMLVGKLVDVQSVNFPKTQSTVIQYIFDTDTGRVGTFLGKGMDSQLAGTTTLGSVMALTYQGKKDLSNGRTMNVFKAELVEAGTGDTVQAVIEAKGGAVEWQDDEQPET